MPTTHQIALTCSRLITAYQDTPGFAEACTYLYATEQLDKVNARPNTDEEYMAAYRAQCDAYRAMVAAEYEEGEAEHDATFALLLCEGAQDGRFNVEAYLSRTPCTSGCQPVRSLEVSEYRSAMEKRGLTP